MFDLFPIDNSIGFNIDIHCVGYIGIPANKLILGVPWYGYNYTCDMTKMESKQSKFCPIPFETFWGVNCSDAAGNERNYAQLNELIDRKMNITEIRWDDSMRAPYFNYGNEEQVYQVWFDDPSSLTLKYQYAKAMGLRGVGPYTFAQLRHTDSDNERIRAQAMWTAFDTFFV